jgi:serine protease Do
MKPLNRQRMRICDPKIAWAFGALLLAFCVCSSGKRDRDAALAGSPNAAPADVPVPSRAAIDDILLSRQNAITRAVAEVSPAVVGINVVQIQRVVEGSPFDDQFFQMFFPRREYLQKVKGLGSGFLISSTGYVLTNEHVVHEASEIVVTTTDGKRYNASLVGSDYLYDVALLKIQGADFPFITLGNSDGILIGEWAIALGNPFGLFVVNSKPTVTVGVISATGMNFQGVLRVEGRSYDGMIQTDAAINGGNSGGPLVNGLGECIGINAFIISGSSYEKTSIGIGFAVPINRVKKILPDLKAFGRINHPSWAGMDVRNLRSPEAGRLGIRTRDGVLIEGLRESGPAKRSGLRMGDVLVAVNENAIHSLDDYQKCGELFDPSASEEILLTIYRNGRLLEIPLSPKGN